MNMLQLIATAFVAVSCLILLLLWWYQVEDVVTTVKRIALGGSESGTLELFFMRLLGMKWWWVNKVVLMLVYTAVLAVIALDIAAASRFTVGAAVVFFIGVTANVLEYRGVVRDNYAALRLMYASKKQTIDTVQG